MPKLKNTNTTFWVIFKHCEEEESVLHDFFLQLVVIYFFLLKRCYSWGEK